MADKYYKVEMVVKIPEAIVSSWDSKGDEVFGVARIVEHPHLSECPECSNKISTAQKRPLSIYAICGYCSHTIYDNDVGLGNNQLTGFNEITKEEYNKTQHNIFTKEGGI